MFGTGLVTAVTLRRRILERLGAEPEWTEGDDDSAEIRWRSGPVTTYFSVEEAAEATRDLAVLRVVTPVAIAEDMSAALEQCNALNLFATTSRWTVTPLNAEEPAGVLQASCSLVVGPDNMGGLAEFAVWCVREQVAVAAAVMAGEVHSANPDRHLPGEVLGYALKEAFRALLQEMFDAGSGAWLSASAEDSDGPYISYEVPFSWDRYPEGVIHSRNERGLPTALVETHFGAHPYTGNGLLVTMRVPRDPEADPLNAVNALNLLGAGAPGSTHNIGAWCMKGAEATYVLYLPAALAVRGIDLPAVMREVLLTLARQALLARRVLLDEADLTDEDRSGAVGLTAPAAPHGLAWGETGEGRNLGAEVLDHIYGKCVGGDTDWACIQPDGFTWWPYQQAQEITAVPRNSQDLSADQGTVIRIATNVRRDVPVTPEAVETIAALNAELPQSALVLRDDGSLILACRVFIHEGIRWWAPSWTQFLAADQFITARELGERLADLGAEAVTGHPVSGLRPQPDELFGIREEYLIPAAANVRAGLSSLVPFIAVTGQYALPHHLAATGDGSVEFTWHPSQQHAPAETDPAIRMEVSRGESTDGIGWVVRSHVPVARDSAARARWCNDRNAELFGETDGDDLTVVGGWGTAPGGTCCLTTWLSPHFVRDDALQSAGLVGNLLRYHQSTVLHALAADPGAVTSDQLTGEHLAAGLESLVSAFAEVLDYPAGTEWSVEPRDAGALVTLEGRTWAGEPLAEMAYDDLPDRAQHGEHVPPHSFRMALTVPLGYNRTELSLLYSALLSYTQSDTRPGETDGFPSDWYARQLPIALESDGLLQRGDDDEYTFTLGEEDQAQAQFEVDFVKFGPNPVESALWMYDPHSMRIAGVVADADAKVFEVADGDVIGTWVRRRDGLAYEVVIPPIPIVWPGWFMVQETLAWIGRHVIERVQAAVTL